ncbi:MAG: Uma2 family endonuclease [Defluviitaleaceae bacterium]|nr:Uma2 family endonuclease [Defluviitaleaceae bacterium]
MTSALKYDYYYEDVRQEIINGQIVMYAPPSATPNHGSAGGNLFRILSVYLRRKTCRVYQGSVNVVLSEKDTFIPDIAVVCTPNIIKDKAIYGAPDMVAEILSPSTARRDKGIKKDTYERYGVKEYWIINIADKSIEVYLLEDGKYILDNVYIIYPEYLLEDMTDEEKARIPMEIKMSIFEDLFVSIEEVFEGLD